MAKRSDPTIPMRLFRHYRETLSTQAGVRVTATSGPEALGLAWLGAGGSKRVEALDRIRAIGERSRAADLSRRTIGTPG